MPYKFFIKKYYQKSLMSPTYIHIYIPHKRQREITFSPKFTCPLNGAFKHFYRRLSGGYHLARSVAFHCCCERRLQNGHTSPDISELFVLCMWLPLCRCRIPQPTPQSSHPPSPATERMFSCRKAGDKVNVPLLCIHFGLETFLGSHCIVLEVELLAGIFKYKYILSTTVKQGMSCH